MSYMDDITDAMDVNLGNLQRWGGTETGSAAIHGVAKSRTRLND